MSNPKVKIVPLENENYVGNNGEIKTNTHGIKTVLYKWIDAVTNLNGEGLPNSAEFTIKDDNEHGYYYGYPDVWDVSKVTDLTWRDGDQVKGLFEGLNLQEVFIRKMSTEWFTFIPAIFFSNLIYFIIINNFSNLSFYYVELLRNSFFTFLYFPIFYFLFKQHQMRFKED